MRRAAANCFAGRGIHSGNRTCSESSRRELHGTLRIVQRGQQPRALSHANRGHMAPIASGNGTAARTAAPLALAVGGRWVPKLCERAEVRRQSLSSDRRRTSGSSGRSQTSVSQHVSEELMMTRHERAAKKRAGRDRADVCCTEGPATSQPAPAQAPHCSRLVLLARKALAVAG